MSQKYMLIHKFANSLNIKIHHTTALNYFIGKVTSSLKLPHFFMNVPLGIPQVFVEHLFLGTPLWNCFCNSNNILEPEMKHESS